MEMELSRRRRRMSLGASYATLLLGCQLRSSSLLVKAQSVRLLEVHVELVSPSGSTMACDQSLAGVLREVAGTCLNECGTFVGFNEARCNAELGNDVVTLSGGIYGTEDAVFASMPCIMSTMVDGGCSGLVTAAIPSIGSIKYIGGIDTNKPIPTATAKPEPPAASTIPTPVPTPVPIPSPGSAPTGVPTSKPSDHQTAVDPTPTTAPAKAVVDIAAPSAAAKSPVNVVVVTAAPAAAATSSTLHEEETEADNTLTGYLVIMSLVMVAVALCCAVGLLIWSNKGRERSFVAASAAEKRKRTSLGPNCTSSETESGGGSSSQARPQEVGAIVASQQRDVDQPIFGIEVPSLDRVRDEPSSILSSSILEHDDLSSSVASSIREDKFDNASSAFYEPPPGEDDTEISFDDDDDEDDDDGRETDGAGTSSEYDFSLSATEFTDLEGGGGRIGAERQRSGSVGSLSDNSFAHYVSFDERDMENDEKRRQFLTWLKASKIIPPAAKYAIESSLVDSFGPLRDGNRPHEVMLGATRAIDPLSEEFA